MEGEVFRVVDQVGPWAMICMGIWWLLATTVLYNRMKALLEPMMELCRWVLEKSTTNNERMPEVVSDQLVKVGEAYLLWVENHQPFFRWSSFGLSFVMIIGGIVWFVN